jgi:hypothetical protein
MGWGGIRLITVFRILYHQLALQERVLKSNAATLFLLLSFIIIIIVVNTEYLIFFFFIDITQVKRKKNYMYAKC